MPTKPKDDPTALPLFEGRRPDTLTHKFTGGVEYANEIAEAHHLDEYVYLVVGGPISKVLHATDKDGALDRAETIAIERCALIEADEAGALMLRLHREARARKGIEELPLGGEG